MTTVDSTQPSVRRVGLYLGTSLALGFVGFTGIAEWTWKAGSLESHFALAALAVFGGPLLYLTLFRGRLVVSLYGWLILALTFGFWAFTRYDPNVALASSICGTVALALTLALVPRLLHWIVTSWSGGTPSPEPLSPRQRPF